MDTIIDLVLRVNEGETWESMDRMMRPDCDSSLN